MLIKGEKRRKLHSRVCRRCDNIFISKYKYGHVCDGCKKKIKMVEIGL